MSNKARLTILSDCLYTMEYLILFKGYHVLYPKLQSSVFFVLLLLCCLVFIYVCAAPPETGSCCQKVIVLPTVPVHISLVKVRTRVAGGQLTPSAVS